MRGGSRVNREDPKGRYYSRTFEEVDGYDEIRRLCATSGRNPLRAPRGAVDHRARSISGSAAQSCRRQSSKLARLVEAFAQTGLHDPGYG
jgi:hypothetical protein